MAVSIKNQGKTTCYFTKNDVHYKLDSVLRKVVMQIYQGPFRKKTDKRATSENNFC